MTSLTSKQRAHLRSLAHELSPIAQIGHAGVTPAALQNLREAFNTRELLKVKVLENAPQETWETADTLMQALEDVHVAQTIGRIVVLYRPHPDDPEIRLPG